MPLIIDHLAEMTGFRDRELLDVAVVRAIKDVLRPQSVAVYRCVGDGEDRRWMTRARLGEIDAAATADPPWTDFTSLPRLADHSARAACLHRAEVVTVGESPQLNIFPITTERETVGVLEIETVSPLQDSERSVVSTILRIFGNFHDLLDHSERDALTGLLNRQTFEGAFHAHSRRPTVPAGSVERRAPNEIPNVWLAAIDIDHFKRVNDNHGHLIGDEVLLLMARLLRSTFHFRDRLYRFGGEEFVVVLECPVEADAARAFERFRSAVEHFAFPQVGRVTASIGFTRIEASETPSAAFGRADKALYFAKEHGRNQVVCFDELVRDGRLVEVKSESLVELF